MDALTRRTDTCLYNLTLQQRDEEKVHQLINSKNTFPIVVQFKREREWQEIVHGCKQKHQSARKPFGRKNTVLWNRECWGVDNLWYVFLDPAHFQSYTQEQRTLLMPCSLYKCEGDGFPEIWWGRMLKSTLLRLPVKAKCICPALLSCYQHYKVYVLLQGVITYTTRFNVALLTLTVDPADYKIHCQRQPSWQSIKFPTRSYGTRKRR